MIYIVDDNKVIADNIRDYLEMNHFKTQVFNDGESAFEAIERNNSVRGEKIECMILDRMMPKLDGLSLARMLLSRSIHIPIIFLTALDKPIDRLEGLEIGAIDYLVKPVELKELVLKIHNIIDLTKHSGQSRTLSAERDNPDATLSGDAAHAHLSEYGIIKIDASTLLDTNTERVTIGGSSVNLSPKEYRLFELIATNRGRVVTYNEIVEKVWHESSERIEVFHASITVHIAYLRKKLQTKLIRTIKLTGYTLDYP